MSESLLLFIIGWAIGMVIAAIVWTFRYNQGVKAGRMQVLDDWWTADNATADRQAHIEAATLDEIVRRNPTGGIVPPFITDRIPGHETDQP